VVREWIEKIKPKRVILTHMNFETDYDEFLNFLPDGVEPAYDGLVINL
jgi:phosphoribosyl 1,2-cyclic phosphate phosphodiesterase